MGRNRKNQEQLSERASEASYRDNSDEIDDDDISDERGNDHRRGIPEAISSINHTESMKNRNSRAADRARSGDKRERAD